MQNTLSDLNNYLFEQLERINDDSLTEKELDRELKKTDSVVKISQQIVKNGELAYKTMKYLNNDERDQHKPVPAMLAIGDK